MIPSISVAVQHHPSRADLLPPLLAGLAPLEVDVVADPEPAAAAKVAWRTYRRALEETPPAASHRLIVQDDALPCRSFGAAVERLVSIVPDRLLVLCVCGEPSEAARQVGRARQDGRTLVEIGLARWVPVVATLWPVELIPAALEFVDEERSSGRWPNEFVADDEIVRRVARKLGVVPVATVPSLVEHPDVVQSVIGKRKARAGANPGRVAAYFLPDDLDPLLIDWRL